MSFEPSKSLLRRLCLAAGPPGAEDAVRAVVRETLAGAGTLGHDRLGSLILERRGTSDRPRVVLDSHLDEVGMMVQSIAEDGRIAFVPLGSWWGHVLLGQRVNLLAEGGTVAGVIGSTPPHFLSPEERKRVLELDAMYIDVGASSKDEVLRLGVRVGDPVVPHAEFLDLGVEGVVSGKAMDDRVGVAVMCEVLLATRDGAHPNTLVGVAAVQEELGARGAGTAAELARPDVAIVLECAPAEDMPARGPSQGSLGAGPQVRHFDPTAVSNRKLVRLVRDVAERHEIAIQLAVRRGGGTDAGAIHRHGAGVPTVVIGVPARYIHSHVAVLHLRDHAAACALVRELVLALDERTAADLVRFE